MFFRCLNYRMQIHESIGTKVGPEASGVLEFDFEFSDAAFGSVVVRRYCRVSKEVEDVVATFEQAVFERYELPVQFGQFFSMSLSSRSSHGFVSMDSVGF